MSSQGPHVVILGAGFAGMGVVKELKKAGVRVTMIDRNNYHTFQPLLYQVATDVLASSEVGFPVRPVLHGEPDRAVHKVAVSRLDQARKQACAYEARCASYQNCHQSVPFCVGLASLH
jgi:NADH dehydrogenase